MNCIAENNVGLQIGSIYCGLVAVADDVLFMADDTEDLQYQLPYMYRVNMPKRNDTKLVILKLRQWYSKSKMENSKFTMNGNIIVNVET